MSAVFLVLVVSLNITLVYRGLRGGIEKFCQFALTAMAVLAVIVLIRVLTLGTPNPALPERSLLSASFWFCCWFWSRSGNGDGARPASI